MNFSELIVSGFFLFAIKLMRDTYYVVNHVDFIIKLDMTLITVGTTQIFAFLSR